MQDMIAALLGFIIFAIVYIKKKVIGNYIEEVQ